MKSIVHHLFYSCSKATELIDRRSIEPLAGSEKFRLRIHLSMCKACSRYLSQSDFMDDVLKKLFPGHQEKYKNMDDSAKKRLIEALEKENKKKL